MERSASAILVQTLAERWWDTTHTFHIADREITITPTTSTVWPALEGEVGIWLGINLLKRRYSNEMIRYFHIKADYKPFP